MEKRKDTSNNRQIWHICVSFGLTIGISIYILGFLIGAHIDEKTGMTPLFTMIGTLLAIGASFARLIKGFHDIGKKKQGDEGEESR